MNSYNTQPYGQYSSLWPYAPQTGSPRGSGYDPSGFGFMQEQAKQYWAKEFEAMSKRSGAYAQMLCKCVQAAPPYPPPCPPPRPLPYPPPAPPVTQPIFVMPWPIHSPMQPMPMPPFFRPCSDAKWPCRKCCPSSTGATGPTGPTGSVGPTGPMGPAGQNGRDGVDGIDGIDGIDGLPGPMGPTGVDGQTGPAGPAGPTGPIGPMGPMGPSGLPGADCITTFFDGVLPLNVLPAMIEDDDPWPVEFDPASRKDGIQLDPSNHVLTVSSGGYYLLNWIGDVSNVNTQGSRLKLYINGAPANGIELDKPGNGILEGQHIVYLNAGDEVQFQFDGTPGTGNFSLDSLFIDVSQLNSWQ